MSHGMKLSRQGPFLHGRTLAVAMVVLGATLSGCGAGASSSGSSAGHHAAPGSVGASSSARARPTSGPGRGGGNPGHAGSRATAAHQAHPRSTPTSPRDRSRFVHYAGAAFGIFHQLVYERLVAGALNNRARRRQAYGATVAAYRNLLRAKSTALNGTALRELYAPLAGLQAILGELSLRLGDGQPARGDIYSANSVISGIERIASGAGVRINEPSAGR